MYPRHLPVGKHPLYFKITEVIKMQTLNLSKLASLIKKSVKSSG